MRPGPLGAFALAIGIALAAAACSSGSSATPIASAGAPSQVPSAAASPSGSGPSASAPASPVVGVVTKVDSAGLDKVSGFTLRTDAGQTLQLAIGTLENGSVFPPGHLAEHAATGVPVRAYFRVEGDRLVVYRLEDAG